MSDQNKALVRRAFEEVWNQSKLTVIDELIASNAVYNDPNVPGGNLTGRKASSSSFRFTGPRSPMYVSRSTTKSQRATRSLPGGPRLAPTRGS